MTLKNILVHVDESKTAVGRVRLAANIAAQHGAYLSAIYVAPQIYLPPYLSAQIGPEIFENQEKIAAAAMAKAEAGFREIAEDAGLEHEWRTGEGMVSAVVGMHARYADLTIVGQVDPKGNGAAASDLPEHLVLEAGRPVLVVPYAGKFDRVGKRIMIAWNASREATRAANDALPMLEQAQSVTVLAVNPKGDGNGHGQTPGADMSLHLARHGVPAEAAHIVADDIDVGNMLLSRAADAGVDMIVMGAYGRSRLHELILGGVTRDILRHMTVPVLMSH